MSSRRLPLRQAEAVLEVEAVVAAPVPVPAVHAPVPVPVAAGKHLCRATGLQLMVPAK